MHSNSLRVMIITQGVSRIVEPLVREYNVVGIVESAVRSTKKRSLLFIIVRRLYGFIRSGRRTLANYSKEQNIPYFYMDNGSSESLERWVRKKNPDVIIVYKMSQLLQRNVFDIPKFKTINLHPSLLPKYRGPNPWFWNYYFVEKKGGVTLHFIDEGEDTGDIIYQEEYAIPLGMKSPQMHNLAIGEIGVNLLKKALNNIEQLTGTPQPEKSPTQRAKNLKMDEHKNIINWREWDIERIWHILRGTELWLNAIDQPGGMYRGQRWSVEGFEKTETGDLEVSKIYRESNRYFVACRDGKIYLDVRFDLKKFVMSFLG
jgi:methionyl-tRNA formyltransferase